MNSTNINMLYHADFLDAISVSEEPSLQKIIWWWLAFIEILLVTRLFLEYFEISSTGALSYTLYTITHFILYPFSLIISNSSSDSNFVPIILVAMAGYFLITYALMSLLITKHSPLSRIERARAISRRKYSRYIPNDLRI